MGRMRWIGFVAVVLVLACSAGLWGASLEKDFVSPPDDARPWVYWFWLNGNITREGITADLEAMKRVGIGGVLIMEVDQGAPLGPVGFMSDEWREMFKHVVSEAERLGLEVNMNNDAGWNGSGGPWIKPEESMQKVVWTETEVEGPQHFEGDLKQPDAVAGFYRDIAVMAFPSPGAYRIPDIGAKAAFGIGGVGPASQEVLPPEMVIEQGKTADITSSMKDGKLTWDVPPGKWTIIRFGHTSTGMQNSPAPLSGRGLECDKLSKEGAEANFNGMMGKLAADTRIALTPALSRSASGLTDGRGGGARASNVERPDKASVTSANPSSSANPKSKIQNPKCGLVATHVDSWENGSQNWTAKMREEFRRLRGYDMMPYMPVMTGRVVGSIEISERFLRDLRQTVSDLVVENYAGHIRKLAHDAGMRFTIEAYGSPCDNIPYGGQADEPMGEFWTPGGAMETCKAMASSAHVYGKPIIGAEAFTAGGHERWREHPASIKALGDKAFCEGINRFVFHRYALQPWTPERRPGMTMGPWGQHYERTQTWWEQSGDWHKYLSRCQYMLRQGLFVADICYVQSETPFQTFRGMERKGYDWDECSADVVIKRMSVKNGRIVLPDGMSYRVLALPDSGVMTPELLRKVKELVKAGAVVCGKPPSRSPSLTGYPKCDEEVKELAAEIWAGSAVREGPPEKVLEKLGVRPDFSSTHHLRYIHRVAGGTDIYFVANPRPKALDAVCTFRVTGRIPELWWPDTGKIERAAVYAQEEGTTRVLIPFEPSGSVFVVFSKKAKKANPVVAISHNGKQVMSTTPGPSLKVIITKAVYGVLDDPARTRDVTAKAQAVIDGGELSFLVSRMAEGDDPAYGIVKTLIVEYTIEGKQYTARGTDPEFIDLTPGTDSMPPCELHDDGKFLILTAWQPGVFTATHQNGETDDAAVPIVPPPIKITGPWTVEFPPNQGAPGSITLNDLISWSEHPNPGVRYFSGTATYRATFDFPPGPLDFRMPYLDLGDVQVMAEVKLNGKDLGILWKPPFRLDIRDAVKPGKNELEIRVTNLWPNRLIGDEELPEDSDRNPDGTLKSWPQWLLDGKPSPTGRYTFTAWRQWKKGEALLPSGLLGPVGIRIAHETTVR